MAGGKLIIVSIFSLYFGVAYSSTYLIALGVLGILGGVGLLFLWDYSPSRRNKEYVYVEPINLRYCSDCGVQILQGYQFCRHCGKKVNLIASPNNRYCKQCGTAVTSGYQFCSNCGDKL